MDEELCNYSERGHVQNHVLNPRPVPDKTKEIILTFHKIYYIFGIRFLPDYNIKPFKN